MVKRERGSKSRRESETECRGTERELQSYHVNEALLDTVQCGSQSAADKAQTR